MDSPPTGELASYFTYEPATDYNELGVAINVVEARKLYRRLLKAFEPLQFSPFA